MVCVPADNPEVVYVACPPLSVTVASGVLPSRNVTVPVGVPLVAVTVAVNVTLWPNTAGLAEETSAVAVAPGWLLTGLTVCVSAAEVLVLKMASPL